MQIKYWKISIWILLLTFLACNSTNNKTNQEALRVFNDSKSIVEKSLVKHGELQNRTRQVDNSLRNEDTVNITRIAQIYDDMENIGGLINQWFRDVPAVPGGEHPNRAPDPNVKPEDLLNKQREFKEKAEYIQSRIQSVDESLDLIVNSR